MANKYGYGVDSNDQQAIFKQEVINNKGFTKFQNIHLNKNYCIKPSSSLLDYMGSYQERESKKQKVLKCDTEFFKELIIDLKKNKVECNSSPEHIANDMMLGSLNNDKIIGLDPEEQNGNKDSTNSSAMLQERLISSEKNITYTRNTSKLLEQNGVSKNHNSQQPDNDKSSVNLQIENKKKSIQKNGTTEGSFDLKENTKLDKLCAKMKEISLNDVESAFREIMDQENSV